MLRGTILEPECSVILRNRQKSVPWIMYQWLALKKKKTCKAILSLVQMKTET